MMQFSIELPNELGQELLQQVPLCQLSRRKLLYLSHKSGNNTKLCLFRFPQNIIIFLDKRSNMVSINASEAQSKLGDLIEETGLSIRL